MAPGMSDNPDTHEAAEDGSRAARISRAVAKSVLVADRTADLCIRLGGFLVIGAVFAIILFIGREALPLVGKPSATLLASRSFDGAGGGPMLAGMDEYETFVYRLEPAAARIEVRDAAFWAVAHTLPIPSLAGAAVTAAYRAPRHDWLFLGAADGRVVVAQLVFAASFDNAGRRTLKPRVDEKIVIPAPASGAAVAAVTGREHNGVIRVAAAYADGTLATAKWEDPFDPVIEPVGGALEGGVTALAMDYEGDKLFAATSAGALAHWYLDGRGRDTPYAVLRPGGTQRRVTAMEFLIGDGTLILGYSDGALDLWFGIREDKRDTLKQFRRIRAFDPLPGPVTHITSSPHNRGFLAASEDGSVHMAYGTTGLTNLKISGPKSPVAVVLGPKLTRVLSAGAGGAARLWSIQNPHPEVTWGTLFGKVHYEGYDRPEYRWQSSSGSDAFEPKLSLTPLILGTFKGAFYGLLFAVPVAVCAALYTSQFMHYRLRSIVKPTVEIMAAMPSVVVGFLAGLWLAPILERLSVSVMLMIPVIPLTVFAAFCGWNSLPTAVRRRFSQVSELALIGGAVVAGFGVCRLLGPAVEGAFFKGDLKQWVFDVFRDPFEQRNCIVIGLAMGFAVIPIIFTISEDALSNVPRHFVSGSFALGASRWQTATRVILPTASPGIFSAAMIGFGRAVGETMIVLMATGNTPIMSFSPFNGMRTLSANIAVEIPEAPVASTHYRVLFVSAVLLFLLTFTVNTAAEIIRQRLRRKFEAV